MPGRVRPCPATVKKGERRVDDSEQVCLAILDGKLERAVPGARGQVTWMAVVGVRVGCLELAAGPERVGEQLTDVDLPPLTCMYISIILNIMQESIRCSTISHAHGSHVSTVTRKVGISLRGFLNRNGYLVMMVSCTVSPLKSLCSCHRAYVPSSQERMIRVGETCTGLDGALRDELRPVGPWIPRLVHAVPATWLVARGHTSARLL